MSWVRRINASGKQRRCENCCCVIDRDEVYFLFADGVRLCIDCPPEEHDGEECDL